MLSKAKRSRPEFYGVLKTIVLVDSKHSDFQSGLNRSATSERRNKMEHELKAIKNLSLGVSANALVSLLLKALPTIGYL